MAASGLSPRQRLWALVGIGLLVVVVLAAASFSRVGGAVVNFAIGSKCGGAPTTPFSDKDLIAALRTENYLNLKNKPRDVDCGDIARNVISSETPGGGAYSLDCLVRPYTPPEYFRVGTIQLGPSEGLVHIARANVECFVNVAHGGSISTETDRLTHAFENAHASGGLTPAGLPLGRDHRPGPVSAV